MPTLYKMTGSEQVHDEKTDFEITDDRGRKIGYRITVTERTFEALPDDADCGRTESKRFDARTSATRDGTTFGAGQPGIRGDTLTEVLMKASARMIGAKKRYAKKFSQA